MKKLESHATRFIFIFSPIFWNIIRIKIVSRQRKNVEFLIIDRLYFANFNNAFCILRLKLLFFSNHQFEVIVHSENCEPYSKMIIFEEEKIVTVFFAVFFFLPFSLYLFFNSLFLLPSTTLFFPFIIFVDILIGNPRFFSILKFKNWALRYCFWH